MSSVLYNGVHQCSPFSHARQIKPDMVSHTSDYFEQLQTAMEEIDLSPLGVHWKAL